MEDGEGERELANRRRDLEREFDGKLRDLKAQHKRQMDGLQRDRQEWEEHRRRQQKELADKAARLKAAEDNARRADAVTAEERKEMERLRERVKDLEQAKLDATVRVAKSQERVEKARQGARSSSKVAPWAAGWSVAGGLLWLATAWGRGRADAPFAALFLAGAGALAAWLAWSLRRTRA